MDAVIAMAEHETSIGLSSDWLTPKFIFDRLELTFEIAPPGPASEFKPYIQARLHRSSPG